MEGFVSLDEYPPLWIPALDVDDPEVPDITDILGEPPHSDTEILSDLSDWLSDYWTEVDPTGRVSRKLRNLRRGIS